jgi:hypothetical protein
MAQAGSSEIKTCSDAWSLEGDLRDDARTLRRATLPHGEER